VANKDNILAVTYDLIRFQTMSIYLNSL